MRKLIFLSIFLLWLIPVRAAITLIAPTPTGSYSPNANPRVSPSLTAAIGDYLIVLACSDQSGWTVTSVTDSQTTPNTYIQTVDQVGAGSRHCSIWYGIAGNNATYTISVTFTGAGQSYVAWIQARGVVGGFQVATSGTTSSVSITTTQSNELLVGAFMNYPVPTVGACCTSILSELHNDGVLFEYSLTNTAGANAVNASGAFLAVAAAFKPNAASTPARRRTEVIQ